ncbi:YvrJ family protein [Neomoorella glycerini]|nr:YvrJ family protein [Moorella glycerini]
MIAIEKMLKLAANYGFPMVIVIYVLVRLEPVIERHRLKM